MNPMNFYMPSFGFQYYPMMAFHSNCHNEAFSPHSDSAGNSAHGFGLPLSQHAFCLSDLHRPTEPVSSSESQPPRTPTDTIDAQNMASNTHLPKPTETIILSFKGETQQSKAQSTPKPQPSKGSKRGERMSEEEEDKDYQPVQEKKKKRAVKYQENENRNIVPNEINQIFSFIQKRNKSGALLERMFDKYPHPEEYSVKRFYLYQMLLKNRLGHYANEKCLRHLTQIYEPNCENWSEEEQRFYMRLTRALIHHFLEEDSVFIILTSKRMKQQKKRDHLHARRYVKECVMKALRGC